MYPPPYRNQGIANTAVLIGPAAQETNLVLGGHGNVQYSDQPFHLPIGEHTNAANTFKSISHYIIFNKEKRKVVSIDSVVMRQSARKYLACYTNSTQVH